MPTDVPVDFDERLPGRRVMMIAAAGIFVLGLAGVIFTFIKAGNDIQSYPGGMWMLAAFHVILRAPQTGIATGPDGVFVRRINGTVIVPWAAVDRFESRMYRGLGAWQGERWIPLISSTNPKTMPWVAGLGPRLNELLQVRRDRMIDLGDKQVQLAPRHPIRLVVIAILVVAVYFAISFWLPRWIPVFVVVGLVIVAVLNLWVARRSPWLGDLSR